MLIRIFKHCSLDQRPAYLRTLRLQDLETLEPVALGSRSGPDREYGLISLKRRGLCALFGRESVYIELAKSAMPHLRALGLNF
jgi:hypothetical protein